MKKLSYTIIFVTIALSSIAQKQNATLDPSNPYSESFAKIHYYDYQLSSSQDTGLIKTLLTRELNLSENSSLRVSHIATSLTATHITFKQFYNNVEVFGGGAKVAVSRNNILFRCIETIFNVSGNLGQLPINFDSKSSLSEYDELSFIQDKAAYFWNGQQVVPGWYSEFNYSPNGYADAAWDKSGNIIFLRDRLSYAQDSTVSMQIFSPDPITPIGATYGGQYVDMNDGNLNVLDPLRITVNQKVTFDNGVFSLKSDFVEIAELDVPVNPIVTSATPEFHFSRQHFGFEQVNAFYHISEYQEYLQSLGYNLVQYPIQVDAQAWNGQDNSSFNPSSQPYPELLFGEGGVDDAEDADVIVHEYGHAISHSASPNTNSGYERRTLDEALGDYFAVSYKKAEYSFGSDKVFNWDGHNPFWIGRTVNNPSNICYENISSFSNIYQYTTVFNAAMFDIWSQLGKNYTDKLMIEAVYGFFQNMDFIQAANMILDADTALSGGANGLIIWEAFDNHCILKWSSVSESNKTNVVPFRLSQEKNLVRIDFLANTGNLQLLDMSGKQLKSIQLERGENQIDMSTLSRGVYVLRIELANEFYAEKIIH